MLSIILIALDVISFHCCQSVINFKTSIFGFLWSDPYPWEKLPGIIHKWISLPFLFLLKAYYLCLACCVLRPPYITLAGKILKSSYFSATDLFICFPWLEMLCFFFFSFLIFFFCVCCALWTRGLSYNIETQIIIKKCVSVYMWEKWSTFPHISWVQRSKI